MERCLTEALSVLVPLRLDVAEPRWCRVLALGDERERKGNILPDALAPVSSGA